MNKFKECNQCPHEFNDKNWEPCKDCVPKKKTNADRIRAMSDEELATFLAEFEICSVCKYLAGKCELDNGLVCTKGFAAAMAQEWLQKEVEE